jgi:N utilization substance protein B
MAKSRRKAREAALRALYELEIGRTKIHDSMEGMKENGGELTPDMLAFAEQLVQGVHDEQDYLDERISTTIKDWDYNRVAVVDRNLLRIAAFEFYFCPDIPPLVTINEAIDLAKKYSTAESGKFVNGVLAKVMENSPKIDWDPTQHIAIYDEEPAEPEPAIEVEEIDENAPEAQELNRIGLWKIRSGDKPA